MNSEKFCQLRQEYPLFVYRSFEEKSTKSSIVISFTFEVYDRFSNMAFCFKPEWEIPSRRFYNRENISTELWNTLLFNIGMIELISYWKCTASAKVEIACSCASSLDSQAVQFWKNIYFDGLGEYFYLNNIETDKQSFMELFPSDKPSSFSKTIKPISIPLSNGIIVPIGGGKDSVVSWHVLNHSKLKGQDGLLPMILNPRGASLECCAVEGKSIDDIAVVKRTIDPLLLELNKRGFLNGHTPFSALLAFTTLLIGALSGRKYVALSNENSANESTVKNSSINHQYSKSFDFEEDFAQYVSKYISPDFYYFSFLRPLSELAIARIFSDLKPYFGVFKSCNVGSKEDIWCANCAKCLFAYIIFSPFMPQSELEKIFGKNMLKDSTLKPILEQLCGMVEVKPFECVGTVDEVNWALQQIRPLWEKSCKSCDSCKEYPLLDHYFSNCDKENVSNQILTTFNTPHRLPAEFEEVLKTFIDNNSIFEWK